MSFQNLFRVAAFLAVLPLMLTPVMAQEPPLEPGAGPGDPELRKALFEYFERRLRIALALTDDQAREVIPKVRSMETERAAAMRERRETSMALRRAYQEGAPDAELEHILQQIDEAEEQQRARTKELMNEIDESLTVRQRVQFRTFLERFRQEIRQRMQEFRRTGRPQRRVPNRR